MIEINIFLRSIGRTIFAMFPLIVAFFFITKVYHILPEWPAYLTFMFMGALLWRRFEPRTRAQYLHKLIDEGVLNESA